jgi:hypothetical protein
MKEYILSFGSEIVLDLAHGDLGIVSDWSLGNDESR